MESRDPTRLHSTCHQCGQGKNYAEPLSQGQRKSWFAGQTLCWWKCCQSLRDRTEPL